MSDYQYTPLGPNEIRLLILSPGESDDPIRGQILHETLDPHNHIPKYQALSYVWGNQDDPDILTLLEASVMGFFAMLGFHDEKNPGATGLLRIGQNLAGALRHLRHKTKMRVLWCDAVCINQKDLTERGAQVPRMGDVYRYAQRVVVWLGPGSDDIHRAMRLLGEVGSNVGFNARDRKLYLRKGKDESYAERNVPLPFSQTDWQCLQKFFALSWFKRLWVRQEITLANDLAIMMSGTEELSWDIFCAAVVCAIGKAHFRLPSLAENDEVQSAEVQFQENLLAAHDIVCLKGLAWGFVPVMVFSKNSECSDPRDRIYGMLSLCGGLEVQPDYTKSVRDVYMDAALALQKMEESLEHLSLCEMADDPSWVPDFTRPLSPLAWAAKICAGSYTGSACEFFPDRTCRAMAVHCGTIGRCTQPMPSRPNLTVVREVVKSWILDSWNHGTQPSDASAGARCPAPPSSQPRTAILPWARGLLVKGTRFL